MVDTAFHGPFASDFTNLMIEIKKFADKYNRLAPVLIFLPEWQSPILNIEPEWQSPILNIEPVTPFHTSQGDGLRQSQGVFFDFGRLEQSITLRRT